MSDDYPGDWIMVTEQKFKNEASGDEIYLAMTLPDHGGSPEDYMAVFSPSVHRSNPCDVIIGRDSDEVTSDILTFMEKFPKGSLDDPDVWNHILGR